MDTPASRQKRSRSMPSVLVACVAAAVILLFPAMAFAGMDDYPAVWKSPEPDTVKDTWGYSNRECESFVAWRLHSRSRFEVPYYGNARDWGTKAGSGYVVDKVPTVGSVAWFSSNHVAWVEAVGPTGGITIEEYNYAGPGIYSERDIERTTVSGFIHFSNPLPPVIPSKVTAVEQAEDGVSGEVQFAIVTAEGRLWHTIRSSDGTWATRGDAGRVVGGAAVRAAGVAGDGTEGEAQFVVATTSGRLWHTIRNADGTWRARGDLGRALGIGAVKAIAGASDGVSGEAQFAILTTSGRLWHTIRRADGSWQRPGDLGRVVGPSVVTGVAAAGDGTEGEAQFIVATADGNLWHTIRRSNGTWQPRGDMSRTFGFGSARAVAAAGDGMAGEAQFAAATSGGRLWHTIRDDGGAWQRRGDLGSALGLGTVTAASGSADGTTGEAQFAVVTSDGRLWHTLRDAKGAWQRRGDLSKQLGLR
jgi:surface antigen